MGQERDEEKAPTALRTVDDLSRQADDAPPSSSPPIFTLEIVDPEHYELQGEQGRGGLGRDAPALRHCLGARSRAVAVR